MNPLTIPYRSGRIAVLADLHWDSYAKAGANPIDAHDLRKGLGVDLDALIIAGDLANGPPENWGSAVRAMMQSVTCDHVYILPGNHDYYLHGLDGDDALQRQAEFAGATFVQKRELLHRDTRILCCTLWTDYELSGYADLSKAVARRMIQDYQRISKPRPDQEALSVETVEPRRRMPITPDDLLALHLDHRAWLEQALGAPHFAGDTGKTVIVTHHGPHPAAAGELDALTAAFHSDLSDLIYTYEPNIWFFGHSHRRLRAQLGGTDIRNVSVGYPNERQVADSGHLTEMCFWGPDG